MPSKPTTRPAPRKVPKTFRLTPRKLEKAQKILGTDTATVTVEQALDMVVFREELVQGAAAMRGVGVDPID